MQLDIVCPDSVKTLTESKLDADVEAMRDKTPQQIIDYLAVKLTTDAGQAEVITRLVKIVYYLLNRVEQYDD